MKLSKLFSTLILLFLFISVQVSADDPEVELDEDGNPIVKLDEAPEWVLVDGQGDTVSSATLAEKPYVLHFWATWCPPCVMELTVTVWRLGRFICPAWPRGRV